MDDWLKEFDAWDKENHNFIEELHEHNSVLYDRFLPVYAVLESLKQQTQEGLIDVNDDIDKIVSVGLEFLHDQLDTCKLLIDTKFKGDFHQFLEYDQVVSALFFIDDLKYELEEKKVKYNRDILEKLEDELEELMDKKQDIKPELNLYVDDQVNIIIANKDINMYGIVDIFSDIADTLGLELYQEDEILIGRDI
ncbi:MAG: hypothetical protein CVV56_02300 [Tenericutes bacterium HGW-Tenericutes-1]|jgi:hypothetical protein|nr:MAG: hypothetical protein CVV56_02300 [Tenericutes bacterium HGW-Tenericutes-1]